MSSQTTNIKLKKPAASETINLTDINNNWDIIDTAFGALGTLSATNNVKYLFDREGVSGKYKRTTSSTWEATASGITGLSNLISDDVKAQIGALADAVGTLAASNSVSANSITLQIITATYTIPSTSASNTVSAGVVLVKLASGSNFNAFVMPCALSTPFYMRRASTVREIRMTV